MQRRRCLGPGSSEKAINPMQRDDTTTTTGRDSDPLSTRSPTDVALPVAVDPRPLVQGRFQLSPRPEACDTSEAHAPAQQLPWHRCSRARSTGVPKTRSGAVELQGLLSLRRPCLHNHSRSAILSMAPTAARGRGQSSQRGRLGCGSTSDAAAPRTVAAPLPMPPSICRRNLSPLFPGTLVYLAARR